MDHQRGRITPFRRDLNLAFAALMLGITGAMVYLYVGVGDEMRYVQSLLAIFLVALALLIWTAVFVRDA